MQTRAADQACAPNPIDPSSAPGAVRYQRHHQEETVLFRLVEQHFPAFQRRLAERERPLPGFVLDKFPGYLACDPPAHGTHDLDGSPCDGHLLRVFAIDLAICPDCGGRLRVFADATRPDVIQRRLAAVARNT